MGSRLKAGTTKTIFRLGFQAIIHLTHSVIASEAKQSIVPQSKNGLLRAAK